MKSFKNFSGILVGFVFFAPGHDRLDHVLVRDVRHSRHFIRSVARFEQLVFGEIRFGEKEKNVNVPQAEEIRRVVNFVLVDDRDHFEELESAVRVQSI